MDKSREESLTLEEERARTNIGTDYVKLSAKGAQEFKNLQYSAVKQFAFWVFVGNVGGFVLSKFIEIPFKDKPKHKLKRYRYTTFFFTLFALSYHGYKLSRYHFRKGKKALTQDPANLLEEPKHEF